jgi:hypothetical protein
MGVQKFVKWITEVSFCKIKRLDKKEIKAMRGHDPFMEIAEEHLFWTLKRRF